MFKIYILVGRILFTTEGESLTQNTYKEKYHWLYERDAYLITSAILIGIGIGMQISGVIFWMNIGISLIASGIVGVMSLYIVYVRRQIERVKDKFFDWGLEDIFPNRSDKRVYKTLIDNCQKCIDIQAETLSRLYSDFKEELKELDEKGVKIRLLVLDPESELCKRREREEESSERRNLSDRIKAQTKDYFELGLENLHLKWYDCTPSVNYFRVDDRAFFGSYFVGTVSRNSLTFLGKVGSRAVQWYSDHFETVWERYSREVPSKWQR